MVAREMVHEMMPRSHMENVDRAELSSTEDDHDILCRSKHVVGKLPSLLPRDKPREECRSRGSPLPANRFWWI